MKSTRRNLIRQVGLTLVGLSISRIQSFALPSAFSVPDADDEVIRLSSNENPYGPSPAARDAMKNSIGISNRYQWQMIRDLITAIAAGGGVKPENIMIGAGSTYIIDSIIRCASAQSGNFIVANPTFNRWAGAAEKSGLQKISVPLTHDKKHDLDAMLRAITPQTRMVYVCNPNNPTGTVCSYSELASFAKEAAKHALVLVDEAYLEYSGNRSLKDLAVENDNLVIVKTFSKVHGLAGARVGYAIAGEKTIERISDTQSGANIDISATSLGAALASLKDNDFIRDCCVKNEKARAYTVEQLKRLGIPAIPSYTNFIYFSLANYKKDFFGLLKEHNIEGTEYFEEDGKWTRITVGTMHEMERFIHAIG